MNHFDRKKKLPTETKIIISAVALFVLLVFCIVFFIGYTIFTHRDVLSDPQKARKLMADYCEGIGIADSNCRNYYLNKMAESGKTTVMMDGR